MNFTSFEPAFPHDLNICYNSGMKETVPSVLFIIGTNPEFVQPLVEKMPTRGYLVSEYPKQSIAQKTAITRHPRFVVCEEEHFTPHQFPMSESIVYTIGEDPENTAKLFDNGADLVLPMPIDDRLLSAYLSRMEKVNPKVEKPLRHLTRDLSIDIKQRYVLRGNEKIVPTRKIFNLLLFMQSCGERMISNEEFYDWIVENGMSESESYVRMLISRAREAVDKKDDESYIKTVRGRGYSLAP